MPRNATNNKKHNAKEVLVRHERGKSDKKDNSMMKKLLTLEDTNIYHAEIQAEK